MDMDLEIMTQLCTLNMNMDMALEIINPTGYGYEHGFTAHGFEFGTGFYEYYGS